MKNNNKIKKILKKSNINFIEVKNNYALIPVNNGIILENINLQDGVYYKKDLRITTNNKLCYDVNEILQKIDCFEVSKINKKEFLDFVNYINESAFMLSNKYFTIFVTKDKLLFYKNVFITIDNIIFYKEYFIKQLKNLLNEFNGGKNDKQ